MVFAAHAVPCAIACGNVIPADQPKKKKYGRLEMLGPFPIRDGEDNYQLYLIRPASSSQTDFINLLFDRPLLLLIVTMLLSSPLLLWLAWSLWLFVLKNLPASIASLSTLAVPVCGVLFSWWLLGENPDWCCCVVSTRRFRW